MVRTGLVNRRVAIANPQAISLTVASATTRLSSRIPAVWGEFSGTVWKSSSEGWAWLSAGSDTILIPVRLRAKDSGVHLEKPTKVDGLIRSLSGKELSARPSPPPGKVPTDFALFEGIRPSGWFGIWGRIIGGTTLTIVLGLLLLSAVLAMFGFGRDRGSFRSGGGSSNYHSSLSQSSSRSEVRTNYRGY